MLNLTVCFDLAHLKSLREKKGAKYIKSPTLCGLSTQTLVEQQGIISKRIKKKHCVSTENSPLFTAHSIHLERDWNRVAWWARPPPGFGCGLPSTSHQWPFMPCVTSQLWFLICGARAREVKDALHVIVRWRWRCILEIIGDVHPWDLDFFFLWSYSHCFFENVIFFYYYKSSH